MASRVLLFLAIAASAHGLQLGVAPRHAAIVMQAAAPQTKQKVQIKPKVGGGGGGGGGAPKAAAAKPKRKAHVEEVPLWKVLLLSDGEYVEDEVCEVLQNVIPEISNQRQAHEKFDEAQAQGKALLLTVPKELGEAYVEQLIRSEPMVFAEIEEE